MLKGASPAEHFKLPMAAAGMRIGLLGGSFNPAHAAHRQISLMAMKRLGLDQVWWLVSPGNPLKHTSSAPDLATRTDAARKLARHPRIVVTDFEGARGTVYTINTLRFLKRRLPSVNFVWLMGADNLASFHRWRDWAELFSLVPIAVMDRPGFRLKARASRAAQRFAAAQIDESDARGLATMTPPAWALLSLPLSRLSSTVLRGDGAGMAKTLAPKAGKASKAAKKEVKQVKQEAKKAGKKSKKKAKRH
ncbi:MAG: nicotinate-nucleotide adenylyltransferase [Methyloceanibacter sp.]|jgi:nicotinate-nucleotide adenylyltransferase